MRNIYNDEEVRRTLETSRETLDRLQNFRVSEPTFETEWVLPPREEEPTTRARPDDTIRRDVANLTTTVERNANSLLMALQGVEMLIEKFKDKFERMENDNRVLCGKITETETRLAQLEGRLVDTQMKLVETREAMLDRKVLDLSSLRSGMQ